MKLFKPVWMQDAGTNWKQGRKMNERAAALIEKTDDQKKLARIAKETEYSTVYSAAVKKLTDQQLLADVATHAKDDFARKKAAEKLTDRTLAQRVFADLAIHGSCLLGDTVLNQIEDQELLIEIAKNSDWEKLRVIAAERITDRSAAQNVYAYIAANDPSYKLRYESFQKLTGQEAIAYLAKSADVDNHHLQRQAAAMVTDAAMLTDIAKNAKDSLVRLGAAEKAGNPALAQEVYTDIARNDTCNFWRFDAAKKLNDKSLAQEVFASIAMDRKTDFLLRKKAAEKLTDPDRRKAATESIDQQKSGPETKETTQADDTKRKMQTQLANIAKYGTNEADCAGVVCRITDKALLSDIAQNAKYASVRKQAQKYLRE